MSGSPPTRQERNENVSFLCIILSSVLIYLPWPTAHAHPQLDFTPLPVSHSLPALLRPDLLSFPHPQKLAFAVPLPQTSSCDAWSGSDLQPSSPLQQHPPWCWLTARIWVSAFDTTSTRNSPRPARHQSQKLPFHTVPFPFPCPCPPVTAGSGAVLAGQSWACILLHSIPCACYGPGAPRCSAE